MIVKKAMEKLLSYKGDDHIVMLIIDEHDIYDMDLGVELTEEDRVEIVKNIEKEKSQLFRESASELIERKINEYVEDNLWIEENRVRVCLKPIK